MFKFLDGLDKDIQQALLNQLRDLWTHTSTAIEGNTLNLGDTKFILDEGLTVSGKPIKDHQEVVGHARAIELIYGMLNKKLSPENFYDMHRAVQSEKIFDIYKPYGAWKVEPNGAYALDDNGKQIFIEYAQPVAVPKLMSELISFINENLSASIALKDAPAIYAKIHMGVAHIHPFWDGNGRIARLVANLPLLNAGLPPIVIATEDRKRYMEVLAAYQRRVGEITIKTGVWPDAESLHEFSVFCGASYGVTQDLVAQARRQQDKR